MIGDNIIDLSNLDKVPDKSLSSVKKIARFFGLREDLIELNFELLSCTISKKPDNHKRALEYRVCLKILNFELIVGSLRSHRSGMCLSNIQMSFKLFGLRFIQDMVLGLTFFHANKQKLTFRMYTDERILSKIICRLIRISFYYIVSNQ